MPHAVALLYADVTQNAPPAECGDPCFAPDCYVQVPDSCCANADSTYFNPSTTFVDGLTCSGPINLGPGFDVYSAGGCNETAVSSSMANSAVAARLAPSLTRRTQTAPSGRSSTWATVHSRPRHAIVLATSRHQPPGATTSGRPRARLDSSCVGTNQYARRRRLPTPRGPQLGRLRDVHCPANSRSGVVDHRKILD